MNWRYPQRGRRDFGKAYSKRGADRGPTLRFKCCVNILRPGDWVELIKERALVLIAAGIDRRAERGLAERFKKLVESVAGVDGVEIRVFHHPTEGPAAEEVIRRSLLSEREQVVH